MSPIIPPARFYVYVLSRLDGRPFYVGKGTGDRFHQHTREAQRGHCKCPKCLIIRGILRCGKDVPVTYPHYTDDEHEAFRVERETIHALGRQFRLCNVRAPKPVPPTPIALMNYREYAAWLAHIDTPKKEQARILREWSFGRAHTLRRAWHGARLNEQDERLAEIEDELADLTRDFGDVYQHRFS